MKAIVYTTADEREETLTISVVGSDVVYHAEVRGFRGKTNRVKCRDAYAAEVRLHEEIGYHADRVGRHCSLSVC